MKIRSGGFWDRVCEAVLPWVVGITFAVWVGSSLVAVVIEIASSVMRMLRAWGLF